MQYPLLSEYVNAIQNASDNFDKLSYLRPVMDKFGEPLRSPGAFAVVFKMQDEDTGRMYAIKCFIEEQIGRQQSYEIIGQTLRKIHSPYLMEVNYLDKELFVDTKSSDETEYPVLQMDWVEGETMESYIGTHYRDTLAIKKLYERFCDLALWLRTKPFAHGDIKPDNIMIKNDGSLVLIDYDGMFVPDFAGKKSPTTGTRAFSHPLRTADDFNRDIDDFALASMSISLLAMSEDANLFQSYGAPDRLLFSSDDYNDFQNSEIFKELSGLGGLFPKLLDIFDDCLKRDDNITELYDEIFDLQTKAPEIISFGNKNGSIVYENDEIILTWYVENATQIFINGIDVSEKPDFRCKAKVADEKFEIKVSNGLKESKEIIFIRVLPKASISLKSSSCKLRKGKETSVRISWNIKKCKSAALYIGNKEIPIRPAGDMTVDISQSTEIKIVAVGLDSKKNFTKKIRINVLTESNVVFTADKYYSLPSVPILLKWNITHAKDVELVGNGKVDKVGEIVVTPQETTIYVLKVTDAFGTSEHPLKIQMLPIPHVKTLNIPTPGLDNSLDIKVSISTPELNEKIPNVEIMGVKLKAPLVPSLTELQLDTKLTKSIEKQVDLWAEFKSLYSYFRNKILSNER